jgi:hypothetical protein
VKALENVSNNINLHYIHTYIHIRIGTVESYSVMFVLNSLIFIQNLISISGNLSFKSVFHLLVLPIRVYIYIYNFIYFFHKPSP